MPDLGSIGTLSAIPSRGTGFGAAALAQIVACGTECLVGRAARNNVEGYAAGPSLDIPSNGAFRFRWSVETGARTISVYVKHPSNLSPRPTLTVKANAGIGIAADASATAPSGTGWVQIGPLAINPTSDGAVWVELANNVDGMMDHCYFDHIQTT